MDNVLVSVIVPVYNAEQYLKRCLDSIMNQKYENFEIILVDDGSADNSPALCDAFADSCSKSVTVIHQPNQGPAAARNAGIDAVNGEFFVCVDCDDSVEPEYLSDFVEAARLCPDVSLVKCGFQKVNDGVVIRQDVYSTDESYSRLPRKQFMALLNSGLAQSPCNSLYCTKVVRKNKLYLPTDLSLGEDMLFNLMYMDADSRDVLVVNQPNYNYISVNDDSLSIKYREDLFQINQRLLLSLKDYLTKWEVDAQSWQSYWNLAYRYYDATIENYRREDAPLSQDESAKIINRILRDKNYQEALKRRNTYLNPFMYYAYRSRSFGVVKSAERLAEKKNSIGKK